MSDVKVPVFEIDGREYEWPGLMTLTVRECRIFHEETGLVWESLWIDGMTVPDLFHREGFLSAMARIAYVREHPEALDDAVRAIIANQPRMALFSTGLQAFRDDEPSEDPKAPSPESESTPSSPTRSEPESKPNGASSKPETSGSDSTPSSDQPDDPPEATGTGGSDPSSMSLPLRRVI
jgi:hypothetical protein